MTDKTRLNFSAKDEALLILEYLENEQMSKTFLSFLDENKHLTHLRSQLYSNYENSEQYQYENDLEAKDFQRFFNLSKQYEHFDQNFLSSHIDPNNSENIFSDEDFLNVGLNVLMSQTPPMDYTQDLPDTSIELNNNEDFNSTFEQLFSTEHETLSTPPHQILPILSDTNPKPSFTKCIVVTQDFLQSMYTQQQSTVTSNHHINSIPPIKHRKRRLKAGKENHSHQRKIMPRTSHDHE